MPKVLFFLGGIFLWFYTSQVGFVLAQTDISSLGVANYLKVKGTNIQNGTIISLTTKGYFPSEGIYDPLVVGVVSKNPAVSLSRINEGTKGTTPVISSGIVEVNVTSENGNIIEGDLITTSSIPGIGMKATKSGYVIGVALGNYSSNDDKAIGKINVSFNVTYSYATSINRNQLKDLLNLSLLGTYESPNVTLKYVVAGIIVLLSFIVGYVAFGRIAKTGLEALGRNPLASKEIQFGIIFNVLITIAIIASGLAIAYVIVRS